MRPSHGPRGIKLYRCGHSGLDLNEDGGFFIEAEHWSHLLRSLPTNISARCTRCGIIRIQNGGVANRNPIHDLVPTWEKQTDRGWKRVTSSLAKAHVFQQQRHLADQYAAGGRKYFRPIDVCYQCCMLSSARYLGKATSWLWSWLRRAKYYYM